MKLFYGSTSNATQNDVQYIDDTNISLPYGITYFKKSMPFLDKLSYEKCFGKQLPELFSYQDFSLWWLILPSLTYSIIDAINFIDKIEIFLKKTNPESVKIIGNFEKFYLVKQICEKNNIDFDYAKSSFLKYSIKNKLKMELRKKYYLKILQKKFKKRLDLFENKSKKIYNMDNKLMVFSAGAYRRKYFDSKKNMDVYREFLIDPLISKINLEPVGIDVDYTFFGETDVLKQRLNESYPWMPLEAIIKDIPERSKSENFVSSYDEIIAKKEFQSVFCYNGINFWSRIESDFKKISTVSYLPLYIDLIEKFEKFLIHSKPKSILIPYEKGSFALALIIVCEKLGINTIGIQHGAFDSLGHNDYAHTCLKSDNVLFGMPIPNKMLVWGNSAKTFLLDKGYPEDRISVIGNPEFFNQKQFSNNYETTRAKFHFPSNKKIILFTTSKLQRGYISDEKRAYDEYVLEELLKQYSNDPEYIIILKPHPLKEPVYVYEKIIQRYQSKNCFIMTDNVLELIELSDLLISVESSTIIDAITLGKMVIQITFDDSSWMEPEIAKNISLLSDVKNLKANIEKILTDNNLQSNFKHEQQKFLREHYNFPNTDIDEKLNTIINT